MKRIVLISISSLALLFGSILIGACGISEPYHEQGKPTTTDEGNRQKFVGIAPNTQGAAATSEHVDRDYSSVLSQTSSPGQSTSSDAGTTLTPAVEVKKELEATDPSTVQLATGKPQLVEFFAFW